MKKISRADIDSYPSRYRASLINCLSGPKAPVLIGTKGKYGSNIALFNSVFHLGANPPLVGMVSRPHTVPRHTLEHILATKEWTVNHVQDTILRQAHQSSAKYDTSEYDAVGLTEEYSHIASAPYVKESNYKFMCTYVNHYPVVENDTIIVIGTIKEVIVPADSINEHGELIFDSSCLSSIGLNNYYKLSHSDRIPYAQP